MVAATRTDRRLEFEFAVEDMGRSKLACNRGRSFLARTATDSAIDRGAADGSWDNGWGRGRGSSNSKAA